MIDREKCQAQSQAQSKKRKAARLFFFAIKRPLNCNHFVTFGPLPPALSLAPRDCQKFHKLLDRQIDDLPVDPPPKKKFEKNKKNA